MLRRTARRARRRRRDERRAPGVDVEPSDLVPGEVHDIAFEMHFTSWVFPAGHRIRLAVSNACFPMIWPTPTPMTLSLSVGEGGSRLVLPVVPQEDRPAPSSRHPPRACGRRASSRRTAWCRSTGRSGARASGRPPAGAATGPASSHGDGPAGPRCFASRWPTTIPRTPRRGARRSPRSSCPAARSAGAASSTCRATRRRFHYRYTRELTENGELIRTRTWEERVPRDHQ